MTERGSALPSALVVLLGGLLVFGLAYDLGRWGATWREAAFAADAGAEAGAAVLDREAAYRGRLELDLREAERVAVEAGRSARPRPERTVQALAERTRVCVSVSQGFRPTLLRMAGIGPTEVAARACAVPRQG